MRVNVLDDYINTLKTCKTALTYFNEGLFVALVDKMIIHKDNVQVVWRDGSPEIGLLFLLISVDF